MRERKALEIFGVNSEGRVTRGHPVHRVELCIPKETWVESSRQEGRSSPPSSRAGVLNQWVSSVSHRRLVPLTDKKSIQSVTCFARFSHKFSTLLSLSLCLAIIRERTSSGSRSLFEIRVTMTLVVARQYGCYIMVTRKVYMTHIPEARTFLSLIPSVYKGYCVLYVTLLFIKSDRYTVTYAWNSSFSMESRVTRFYKKYIFYSFRIGAQQPCKDSWWCVRLSRVPDLQSPYNFATSSGGCVSTSEGDEADSVISLPFCFHKTPRDRSYSIFSGESAFLDRGDLDVQS